MYKDCRSKGTQPSVHILSYVKAVSFSRASVRMKGNSTTAIVKKKIRNGLMKFHAKVMSVPREISGSSSESQAVS